MPATHYWEVTHEQSDRGCQTLGIYPYREAQSERSRTVAGLTDLSARVYAKNMLGGNLMSFAAPLALFNEMEGNVEGSFLQRDVWRSLLMGKESIVEGRCRQRLLAVIAP